MRYSINGDFYRVMRITGPTHNLLGLAFSGDAPQGVTFERLAGSSKQSIDEGASRKQSDPVSKRRTTPWEPVTA